VAGLHYAKQRRDPDLGVSEKLSSFICIRASEHHPHSKKRPPKTKDRRPKTKDTNWPWTH